MYRCFDVHPEMIIIRPRQVRQTAAYGAGVAATSSMDLCGALPHDFE
jgi:hypothetical protein